MLDSPAPQMARSRARGLGMCGSCCYYAIHSDSRLVVPLLDIELLTRNRVLRVSGVETQCGETVQLLAQLCCKGSVIVLGSCEDKGLHRGLWRELRVSVVESGLWGGGKCHCW